MALIETCCCCSLRVAASVLAVYTSVAYLIAFFMEFWWIWEAEGRVPYVEFILMAGYFLQFMLAVIVIRGITERILSHLIIWIAGMIAMAVPEGGLVVFMSFNFWRIHSLYGLTELTFWICRVIVNVCTIVCIQSLHSYWKEENEVISSLRDLNKVSTAKAKSRRSSISSDRVNILNSYVNPGYSSLIEFEKPIPTIKRTESIGSLSSRRSMRSPSPAPTNPASEFDASKFRPNGWPGVGGWPGATAQPLRRMTRSLSLGDLSQAGGRVPGPTPVPRPVATTLPRQYGSLDRRKLSRANSVAGFYPAPGRLHAGYFGPLYPPPGFLLDPYGHVVYVPDPRALYQPLYIPRQPSRHSLPDSDDTHKYRDVAL